MSNRAKKRQKRKQKKNNKSHSQKPRITSNKPNKSKSNKTNFKFCIALDFGTHGVALAYCWKDENNKKHVQVHEQWDNNKFGPVKKPRCTILLNEKRKLTAFGIDAQTTYFDLPSKMMSWMLFDRFKMSLYDSNKMENVDIKDELTSINGNTFSTEKLFIQLFKHLQKQTQTWLKKNGRSNLKAEEIQWIISVPAIWNNNAKNKIKLYAKKAGLVNSKLPNQCKIVYEPDCTSKLVMENKKLFNVSNGDKYLLVDAGGSTVDIGCYVLDMFGAKETCHPTGTKCGSRHIDDRYGRLLEKIFSQKWMNEFKSEDLSGYVEILYNFEVAKHTFDNKKEFHDVELPQDLCKFLDEKVDDDSDEEYGDVEEKVNLMEFEGQSNLFKLDDQILKISSTLWRSKLFDPVINPTINKMKELLQNSSIQNCKHLFLVGGFSCSPYFQYRFKQEFEGKLRIITPENPILILSVVKGAALLGLQDPDEMKRARESEHEFKENENELILNQERANKNAKKIFENKKSQAKKQLNEENNSIKMEYKQLELQINNVVQERMNKDEAAMVEYEKDLREGGINYKKQVESIIGMHDEDILRIETISNQNIKVVQDRDKELIALKEGEKARNNYDKELAAIDRDGEDQKAEQIFENTKMQTLKEFEKQKNSFDKEYKGLKLQINNIVKERIDKDKTAMSEYEKDLKDFVHMNEYTKKLESIEIKYNNCVSQIEKLFDENSGELMEYTSAKERNDEEAKKQYDNTIKNEQQRYTNKLEIIKDFQIEYKIHTKNKAANDKETMVEYTKYLKEAQQTYEEKLAAIESKYNNDELEIEEMSIQNIKFIKQKEKELTQSQLQQNKQNKIAKKLFEAEQIEAKQKLESRMNSFGKEYEQLKLQINNIVKDRIGKDESAMIEYGQDLNGAMNEYRQEMESIDNRCNNCKLEIEKLFDGNIDQLMEYKEVEQRNNEEAKNEYYMTIERGEQIYKNKLEIIKDFYVQCKSYTNECTNNLEAVQANYEKELEILHSEYSKEIEELEWKRRAEILFEKLKNVELQTERAQTNVAKLHSMMAKKRYECIFLEKRVENKWNEIKRRKQTNRITTYQYQRWNKYYPS